MNTFDSGNFQNVSRRHFRKRSCKWTFSYWNTWEHVETQQRFSLLRKLSVVCRIKHENFSRAVIKKTKTEILEKLEGSLRHLHIIPIPRAEQLHDLTFIQSTWTRCSFSALEFQDSILETLVTVAVICITWYFQITHGEDFLDANPKA